MHSLLVLAALLAPSSSAAVTPAIDAPSASPSVTVADAPALPFFSASVAIAGDVAFVGEPLGADGRVWMYERAASGWKRGASMTPGGDAFGFGQQLATDGRTLLVAQIDRANGADSARGRVHVYAKGANGAWVASGVLMATERVNRASFGASLALAGDFAFVGAPGQGGGVVHVFKRAANGSFSPAGTVSSPEIVDGDNFGASLAASATHLVVGAPGDNVRRGSVQVFRLGADGKATFDAALAMDRAPENTQLGLTVALAGDRVIAGAPGAMPLVGRGRNASLGTITVFEYRPIGGLWKEAQTLLPHEAEPAQFGAAIAVAGDELLVGAPAAGRGTGSVYVLRAGANGMQAMPIARGDFDAGGQFGRAIAATANSAVIGLPGDAGGLGTVAFYAKRGDTWELVNTDYPEPPKAELVATTGKEAMCEGGKASQFECGNASLLSFLPIEAIGGKRGTRINDSWGWTDPQSGKEIAIVGRTDGTAFIDVSDPANPKYLGNLPKTKGQPSAAWRDMKVYKDHAFIVADNAGEHGMQVFDLTRLRGVTTPQEFTPDLTYDRINSAHNIVSNVETGFMYVVGASGGAETCGGGYHMIDVREPKRPKFAGCYGDPLTGRAGTGYSHDAQCVVYKGPDAQYKGREICIGSNETALSIADVTDKNAPKAISRATYPNVAYAHQAWLTDDQRFLYLNDEGDESSGQGKAAEGTRTLVWDLSDLDDPVLVKEHVGTTRAIDHNLYVVGDRMYQANYTSGLRILDVSNPRDPKEVGYMDTHPGSSGNPEFAGAWSVYPFFKSGTIVVSSIGEGVAFVKDRTRPVVQ